MNEIDEELNQTQTEPSAPAEPPEEEEPKKPFSDALDWVSSIVYAVAAMLVLNLFFFRSITVSGPSMLDTLEDGDQVIVTNFCYTPKYGDIVVIQANKLKPDTSEFWGEPIIKRVIAVEGDTVMINFNRGEVYLNGELLEEDYIKDLTYFRLNDSWMESGKEYTVPENCVFVLGDNRPVSNDSRNLPQIGFVDKSFIMGKAFVRVAPSDKFKWL
ncbi:MAG: signal peptidase I [Ruminococcaceae bacterium]|nr:signal peptidase I [Oscillospiraceae bacterium]